MSVTSGFFNSLNHDRLYDATQMSQIFDGIIRDGVYESIGTCFAVNADGSLYVTVGVGRAWFNHTWIYNDAILPLALTEEYAPEVLTNRYDAIVLDIDSSPEVRADSIIIVKGTPSAEIDFRNYVAGTVPESITLINEENHHQYPIAIIERPASQTVIKGSEIHNMVGTDYCPFVTGILEVLSADTFFKEWAAELDEFVNDQEDSFSKWSAAQRLEFLTWSQASKDDFDLWMTTEQADFNAWYANLRLQLDGDVATHLQGQISDLQRDKLDVSRYETEIGDTDISQLGNTITAAIMNSGGSRLQITIERDPDADIKNIVCEAVQGDYILTANMDSIDTIEFSGFRELTPIVVTITYDFEGEATVMSNSVTVECYKKYSMQFKLKGGGTSGFDISEWLTAGRWKGTSYIELDEVLNDEKCIRQLFTVHDSVDYLITNIVVNLEVANTILDNDLVAKWINLRDYALDALYANDILKNIMDEVDKYGYGEWVLLPQVPTMSNDTTPSGKVLYSSQYTPESLLAWKAFDNNDSTTWTSNTVSDSYIGYMFEKPIKLSSFKVKMANGCLLNSITWQIVASNEESFSTKFETPLKTVTGTNFTEFGDNFEVDDKYKYYRLRISQQTYGSGHVNYGNFSTVQFYAWGAKGAVPVMTGNNAPYGEIVSSGYDGTEYSWYAFDGNPNTRWYNYISGTPTIYNGYAFVNPCNVRRMFITVGSFTSSGDVNITAKLYGRNNSSETGTLLLEETLVGPVSGSNSYTFNVDNNEYYLQYYVVFTNNRNNNSSPYVYELQFYGRELKVSVPNMTSNTEPFGEVQASSDLGSGYEPYWAFNDKPMSSNRYYWHSGTIADIKSAYILFDFKKDVCVKFLKFQHCDDLAVNITSFNIYGVGNTDKFIGVYSPQKVSTIQYFDIKNNDKYRMYKLVPQGVDASSIVARIQYLNFYGLDYSEREFAEGSTMKYIYDHGIEFEEITTYGQGKKLIQSLSNKQSVKADDYTQVVTKYDLTNYSLIRYSGVTENNEANPLQFANIASGKDTELGTKRIAAKAITRDEFPFNMWQDCKNVNSEVYFGLADWGSVAFGGDWNEWWLE